MKLGFVRKLWKHPEATQIARLREWGVPELKIWIEGRGAETAQEFVNACRNGDEVFVASDLRVFGTTLAEILGITSQLEKKRVAVRHTDHDKTLSEMIECAKVELAKYNRWKGSKKDAKRTGARGGRKKGENAAAERAKIMPPDSIHALVGFLGCKVTWRLISKVTGFSVATLRRRYRDAE